MLRLENISELNDGMDYCFFDCIGWNSYSCGYVEFLKMNERILELAEQAGINMDSFQFSGTPIKHIVDEPSLEKFAELIIRECAEVAQDFVTVENNKLVEKIHISPWHLQDKIKEHFGVEE